MDTKRLVIIVALSMGASACVTEPETLDVCSGQEPAVLTNGVNLNGISLQGVNLNGISLQGVNLNGVNLNGVNLNGNDLSCGSSDLALFGYIVRCALTAQQAVDVYLDGETYELQGDIGLAPEWRDGTCDGTCQGWVSACLIAMSNGRGEHVEISMRGNHEGLSLDDGELEQFPVAEATYYGNLFEDSSMAFACLADGNDELDRVCADLEACPVSLEGRCSDLCDAAGCTDSAGARYAQTISVFRDAP